ncbi:hypothetical protein TIFTF001_011096, partial [Ficus carica]|jgi:hypothetical protein
LFF